MPLTNALTPKQIEFVREGHHRWNFKGGATRSGKTYLDFKWVIPMRIRERAGKDGLAVILGVTKSTIERNVLEPMRALYGDELVGAISSDNTARIFGERCYCLGAEKVSQVSKLRGSSIKYAYGDEVADWSADVFELLKSRLDRPWSCFDGTYNPQGPNHWLKGFLESGADIFSQRYTIFDNPFLPPEFVDNLCQEYAGTVYYQRYILGEWALAEGLIYPMYQDAIAEPPEGEPSKYVLSIDYGTMNAFAAGLWALYGATWYQIDEYYYSGRDEGTQKTDEEYADDLDKFTAGLGDEWRKLRTIIDPSAASMIAMLRRRRKYHVIPADNAVLDGIRETATCLKSGKVKVSPACKNWVREAGGYVWDENADEDRPVKVEDHAMDQTRYFVKTMNLAKPKSKYVPIYAR